MNANIKNCGPLKYKHFCTAVRRSRTELQRNGKRRTFNRRENFNNHKSPLRNYETIIP